MRSAFVDSHPHSASGHEEHIYVQSSMADWLSEWFPARQGQRVLEVGAGTGVFTTKLLPWAGSLLATDISPAMCAEGCIRLPHVAWRIMAAEKPLPGPWDWITCSCMLQWVRSPEQVLTAWREALSPRGRILGGLFVAESLPELRSITAGEEPVAWRGAEEWRLALEKAGLRRVRDETQARTFIYSSADAFLRSLHGVGANTERRFAPPALRELLHQYDTLYSVDEGVRATWAFYRFEAERI